jgi:transketolase
MDAMPTTATTIEPAEIRRLVLEESKRANVGHIGSALSIAEILAALYGRVLRISHPDDPERDRFLLSKGHAALALYAALHLRGWVTRAQLATYCADDSLLGVHPEHALAGVDVSTGSLGQGLSVGVGAALAARMQGSARRVYVLISDAECNEGAVWEAAMFAAHHRLTNLTAIIDLNGQQALGPTAEVLDLSPMAERWRAFGWDAREVDGHDVDALAAAMTAEGIGDDAPRAVIARTVCGKGVSYMEGQVRWHYLPMDDAQYAQAVQELESRR